MRVLSEQAKNCLTRPDFKGPIEGDLMKLTRVLDDFGIRYQIVTPDPSDIQYDVKLELDEVPRYGYGGADFFFSVHGTFQRVELWGE